MFSVNNATTVSPAAQEDKYSPYIFAGFCLVYLIAALVAVHNTCRLVAQSRRMVISYPLQPFVYNQGGLFVHSVFRCIVTGLYACEILLPTPSDARKLVPYAKQTPAQRAGPNPRRPAIARRRGRVRVRVCVRLLLRRIER